jgi:UDP-N-acetylglucosamine enolpyruvyl transferase
MATEMEMSLVMDRIERLAFQAGVAAGGGAKRTQPDQPKEEHTVIKKLRHIGKSMTSCTGTALYGPLVEDNIEWSELIGWAQQDSK